MITGNGATKLSAVSKKIFFFLVWANEINALEFATIANEVQLQHRVHFEALKAESAEAKATKPENPIISGKEGVKIIEEVDT